ncbi:Cd1 [uncultured Bacteroides sp.]|nr:Cd1 [uncultured Bacteroides sp.]
MNRSHRLHLQQYNLLKLWNMRASIEEYKAVEKAALKITVITGSPRKKGNSFAMTKAFVKAAEQRGHTIQRFDAAFLKIGGCHACMTCYKTGKACSFDDDFNFIAPAILESDAVVFSMPVY